MNSSILMYDAPIDFLTEVDSAKIGCPRNKRAFDFFVSLTALVILSPLLLIIALLVKFTSPGPILYKQERLGFKEKPFIIFKFRTLKHNTNPRQDGDRVKKNDPRKTVIGNFLRKTHLDELPQLWNVLCGKMSLVGPRPLSRDLVNEHSLLVPDYGRRHLVVPGISCFNQIKGRIEILAGGAQEGFELDMLYIKKRSMIVDCIIIFRTIIPILRQLGH